MDTIPDKTPPGWREILEASEAEIAGGLTVSGREVMGDLRESLAHLVAKRRDRINRQI